MTTANPTYCLPPGGDTADTFSGRLDGLSNNGFNVKNQRASTARRWLDAQQHESTTQQADDSQSFFDFEPRVEPASPYAPQYPSLPDTTLTPAWHPVDHRIPSPPHSAVSPPPSWPPFQYQPQLPAHNILTDIYPDARVQYGQNTPPDDAYPNLFTVPDGPPAGHESPPSETRQLRQPTSGESKGPGPKRSRKHGRLMNGSSGQTISNIEEVRRCKFLERNRIAASKCRQKKKEWTQNLESRARDLQKENNSLRIMAESMRDEMLFVKGEMLKHSTCGCEQIQEWVKDSAATTATSPMIKTEHSPINSAPNSRQCSPDTSPGASYDQGHSPFDEQRTQRSSSQESQSLEGLLLNQLMHDTSDEGIARTLQASK
ncbi:MAG: hypothetical protein Q9220_005280 [cf. Caloplaca sp. 1 TL-2023]